MKKYQIVHSSMWNIAVAKQRSQSTECVTKSEIGETQLKPTNILIEMRSKTQRRGELDDRQISSTRANELEETQTEEVEKFQVKAHHYSQCTPSTNQNENLSSS